MGKVREESRLALSQDVLQLRADVAVLLIIVDVRVVSDKSILRANVDGIVDLPVDIPHLPGRVEQTLATIEKTVLADHITGDL